MHTRRGVVARPDAGVDDGDLHADTRLTRERGPVGLDPVDAPGERLGADRRDPIRLDALDGRVCIEFREDLREVGRGNLEVLSGKVTVMLAYFLLLAGLHLVGALAPRLVAPVDDVQADQAVLVGLINLGYSGYVVLFAALITTPT